MKTTIRIILATLLATSSLLHAEDVYTVREIAPHSGTFQVDKRIGICPPATAIGGSLLLIAVGLTGYTDVQRRNGHIKTAHDSRLMAVGAMGFGLGFIGLGIVEARYIEGMFSVKTYIRF